MDDDAFRPIGQITAALLEKAWRRKGEKLRGASAVIPVGTNAEFNAAGEIHITPAPLSTQKRE